MRTNDRATYKTAEEVLGYKAKVQTSRISKDSWELVEERKRPKNNIKMAKSDNVTRIKYGQNDNDMKKTVRQDKRKCVDNLAI